MTEPTGKYSITMPRDIAEAARARSGPSGLSGYVAAAVARQIERDNLNELIAAIRAAHGHPMFSIFPNGTHNDIKDSALH